MMTNGPAAEVGDILEIKFPRPRDRKALNHEPRFKEIRAEVVNYLLSCKQNTKTTISKKLRLPDIEPEDLSVPRNYFSPRREPIRRRELKEETVEVGK